jgi:ferredoxin-NADP reductase
MSTLFHPLRVKAIEPDTHEAVIVSFEVPADLQEVFGFTQGQYLTLRHDIDGQDLRRSYSICAAWTTASCAWACARCAAACSPTGSTRTCSRATRCR